MDMTDRNPALEKSLSTLEWRQCAQALRLQAKSYIDDAPEGVIATNRAPFMVQALNELAERCEYRGELFRDGVCLP